MRKHNEESNVLTKFEENCINEIALSLFNYDVSATELAERLRTVSNQLGCSVDEVIAVYVRNALTVLQHTRRFANSSGLINFDLKHARSQLRNQLRRSAAARVALT